MALTNDGREYNVNFSIYHAFSYYAISHLRSDVIWHTRVLLIFLCIFGHFIASYVILCHIIKDLLPYDKSYFCVFFYSLQSVSFMRETPCSTLQLVCLVGATGAPGVVVSAQGVLRHSAPFAADPLGAHIYSNLCLSMSTCIHAYSCVCVCVCVHLLTLALQPMGC